MQNTSALHKSIFADFASCCLEYKVEVNGVEYTQAEIEEIKTPAELYPSTGAAVGNCICREIDLAIRLKEGANIPRAAQLKVFVRLVRKDSAGNVTEAAEWLPKGVFYIDTREADTFGEILTVHGLDGLFKANAKYQTDGETGDWPRSMANVAEDIAGLLGVSLDSRTQINPDYMAEYPNDLTMQEVLGYIAAAHAANWIMTDAGELYMVPLVPGAPVMDVKQEMIDWASAPAFPPYSKVIMWWDDENAYEAGDDSGRTLEVDCVWATQDMVDAALEAIRGYAYQPYEAVEAALDPALELGDSITANGLTSVVATYDMMYDALQMSTISAPYDREEDHELGDYQGPTSRALARKVTLGSYYYGVSITRQKGLEIKKTDGEEVIGEALFNSDVLSMRALIDGQMVDCIYFDTLARRYRLSGNVLIDGNLVAESVYAEQGDIAQLTVDWLDTSNKVRRYLEKDTSDMNHIVIHEQKLQFVTASVKFENSTPLTEQLSNRYGQPVFWAKDITGAEIRDGNPYIDGERVFTTIENTGFPCTVYKYSEAVKRESAFDTSEARIPYDSYGAGYGADDPDKGKGFVKKNTNSFDLWLLTSTGAKHGIFIGDDFTDIAGLRKTEKLDFSSWDSGTFTEKVQGIESPASYAVEFDGLGRPVKITDGDGHEMEVTW